MKIVEVSCDQKTEGVITIIFSIIMMILGVTYWLTECNENLFFASILIIVPIVLFGIGIWLYYYKKSPRKIDVTIGGFANKIYIRNKLLFILYKVMIYGALLFILKIVIELNEDKDLASVFMATRKNLLNICFASLIVAYKTVQDYLGYYSYYKTLPTIH